MVWINFLHLYQPANSEEHIIEEATQKSYLRILRSLEENPEIKYTLNISGCLFLRWKEMGRGDLIKRIKNLIERGQIDLTGTAAYHPFLPLIPKEETRRQIKENEEILKKYLGENFKPRGFFIPEMAYSKDVAKIIKKMGYSWIILDEISYSGKIGKADTSKVYQDEASGLDVVLRSRRYSNGYFPDKAGEEGDIEFALTGNDGELYGLRHEDPTGEYEKFLQRKDLKTETVSEFISRAGKDRLKFTPWDCSWESTEKDLKKNKPYILWYNRDNITQIKIWELANLTYRIVQKHREDPNYYWARWHLVRGLASCTFWWASEKNFEHIFGPYAWNPDEIEKRINELVKAVRSLEASTSLGTKIKVENMSLEIKKVVWEKHWKIHEKKIRKK